MTVTALDALVLDARLRQSLVTVRSLGRRGLAIGVLETVPDAAAFSSRWCHETFVCPALIGTTAYRDYLAQLLTNVKPPVIIPSHDGTIALLRRHRTWLERRAWLALASEPALGVAVNKERTLDIARRLGVPVPHTAIVRNASDVLAALDEIGLPAVAKPVESWCWNHEEGTRVGAQVLTTAEEAHRVVSHLAQYGQAMLFQPLLTGRREAVSLFYAKGTVHARFAQWAKRTGPPLGGESVLRQSIELPADLGRHSERLIRAIDLEGYSEIEFRRDAHGVPYLMEINPRLSASVEIAVRCGVDFPHLLYQWASGQPVDTVEHYRAGAWMRYLKGDLMTTIAALRERGRPGVTPPVAAVIGFGLSFLKPMGYDYVDWQDPLPAVTAIRGFMRDTIRSVAKRSLSAWGPGQSVRCEEKVP